MQVSGYESNLGKKETVKECQSLSQTIYLKAILKAE
jgi:hypothetical protein